MVRLVSEVIGVGGEGIKDGACLAASKQAGTTRIVVYLLTACTLKKKWEQAVSTGINPIMTALRE